MNILSLLYLALSLFGLGFLIFIHEYGHYYIGKKMGMKVETFSIGFGKPIKTWKSGDVVFQLGSIPFGGYVKFKGLDGDRSSVDGFYSVPFYKRIFVALAGPLANLLLALVVFILIYFMGGRTVDFQEKNPFVGYLRKGGLLYTQGLREGDKITQINGHPYQAFQDFMIEKVTTKGPLHIEGEHFGFGSSSYFDFTMKEGGFYPGNYLIFEKVPQIVPQEMAYLKQIGLKAGDRLLTLNGSPVFSKTSLIEQLQEPSVLVHVMRDDQVMAFKVLKLNPSDIRLSRSQQGELTDWMHGAALKAIRYYIPYDLNQDLQVEGLCEYLNEKALWQTASDIIGENSLDQGLQVGDKIVALNGQSVSSGSELIAILDKDSFHVIAQKKDGETLPIKKAIEDFWQAYTSSDYQNLWAHPELTESGSYIQFHVPVIKLDHLQLSSEEKARQEKILEETMARINKIKDPKVRAQEIEEIEAYQKRFMIGGQFRDQMIKSNPSPFHELYEACAMTFKTIGSLFKGALSPKQLSGPVAIVGVMQHGAKKGVTEGLYYFAVVSINLALFNLLPLPVLDGGHICFALYEGIFRKPVPQKFMERLTFVFVILLIALIIYATYNDLLRFIKGIF